MLSCPSSSRVSEKLLVKLIEVDESHAGVPLSVKTAALLADVSPLDVPRLKVSRERASSRLDRDQALVLSCVDGSSSLEEMVDRLGLPTGEVLEIVCGLCAHGVLELDRARRAA